MATPKPAITDKQAPLEFFSYADSCQPLTNQSGMRELFKI